MTRLFWLSLLAFPLAAFDTATEVAQLREAMNRAYAAKDAAALVKCLASNQFAVIHSGAARDLKVTSTLSATLVPWAWKIQIFKANTYRTRS